MPSVRMTALAAATVATDIMGGKYELDRVATSLAGVFTSGLVLLNQKAALGFLHNRFI